MIRKTIATAALVLASTGITAVPASADVVACEATYTVTSAWNDTRDAVSLGHVTVKNTGTTTIKGWRVSWRYTDGSTITTVWGAVSLPVVAVVGAYAFGNESYNGVLPSGGSTVFGFAGRLGGGRAPEVTCRPVV